MDEALLLRALHRLGLAGGDRAHYTRLTAGASLETFHVSCGGAAFCLRRRGSNAGGVNSVSLNTEALLLAQAHDCGIPVPTVRGMLVDADGLGEGYFMSWLQGETLGGKISRSKRFEMVRPRLALQCGRILARIHSMPTESLKPVLVSTDAHTELMRWRAEYLRVCSLRRRPAIDYAFRWLMDHPPRSRHKRSVVHGDFRNGNLMCSAQAGVVGVLDWELAHLGDRHEDLGWLCVNSWRFGCRDQRVGGFGDVAQLIRGYEEVAGAGSIDLDALMWWEAFGSVRWAVICLGFGFGWRVARRVGGSTTVSMERVAIGRRASEAEIDALALLLPTAATAARPAPGSTPVTAFEQLPLALGPKVGGGASIDGDVHELVDGARQFLAGELLPALRGDDPRPVVGKRTRYLARVSLAMLEAALRDLREGPFLRRAEHSRLVRLLRANGGGEGLSSLTQLRNALSAKLAAVDGRTEVMERLLASPSLHAHLWQTAIEALSIDNPQYSTYRSACGRHGLPRDRSLL